MTVTETVASPFAGPTEPRLQRRRGSGLLVTGDLEEAATDRWLSSSPLVTDFGWVSGEFSHVEGAVQFGRALSDVWDSSGGADGRRRELIAWRLSAGVWC